MSAAPPTPAVRLADRIDRLTTAVGRGAAWLYPALVVVLVANVVLRRIFGIGSIELEELQWHLYAAAFLLGLAYTYAVDEHVRVDLWSSGRSPRTRAWVELLGALLLLLPFALVTAGWALDFFWRSFELGERSPMPSGLPARWVIKGVLLAAMTLLALQAIAVIARQWAFLRGSRAGD